MGKKVGTVSIEDAKRMLALFERKCALENLTLIGEDNPLIRNEELYEKFISDYTNVGRQMQNLWNEFYENYHFERVDNEVWNIDFNTGDIYLNK